MRRILLLLAALTPLTLLAAACEADEAEEADPEPDEEEEHDDHEDEDDAADYDPAEQPDDASVSFVTPQDGDTVSTPVTIELDTEGFELASVDNPPAVGEGHLHVLAEEDCFPDGEVIPGPSDDLEDANEIWHFSDGQAEDEIDLDPGEYELCAQIGDSGHMAYGQTDVITVTVEE